MNYLPMNWSKKKYFYADRYRYKKKICDAGAEIKGTPSMLTSYSKDAAFKRRFTCLNLQLN